MAAMTMERVLETLGVSDGMVSAEDRRRLNEEGYLIWPDVFDLALRDRIVARLEELWEEEGEKAGLEVHQQPGTRRLADLVNKGAVFDAVWQHPRVLAAAYAIFRRPFKLFSLNARDALPGQGAQALHADWGPREADEPCRVVNAIWMLDPFRPETGATRIVPGSHRLAGGPTDHLADPAAPHPHERLAVGEIGSVLVYNAHAWHGGTRNQGSGRRRALHCAFVDRDFPQQTDQRHYLRPETAARLSPAARYLLDV